MHTAKYHHIWLENIKHSNNHSSFKNRSIFEKKNTLVIQGESESAVCPVLNMRHYLAVRPAPTMEHPLFIHVTGNPLTRYQFNSVLQKALASIGNHNHYSTHSFRIGRATDLAIHGISEQIIRTSGRWRSDVYSSYVRI
jgi:site-specific recombinase XerD